MSNRDTSSGRWLAGGFQDLTGQRFGSLVVIGEGPRRRANRRLWLCRCDCGRAALAQPHFLKTTQKTCAACGHRSRTKHGHSKALKTTPTYRSWQSAIARCFSKRDSDYPRYGGRGITMCDRWRNEFTAFLADLGERPAGTSIDRIDVNGNYEPGNCRWATPKQQTRNRRVTKLKAHEPAQIRWLVAEGFTMASVGRLFGIAGSTVWKIVNNQYWAVSQ